MNFLKYHLSVRKRDVKFLKENFEKFQTHMHMEILKPIVFLNPIQLLMIL